MNLSKGTKSLWSSPRQKSFIKSKEPSRSQSEIAELESQMFVATNDYTYEPDEMEKKLTAIIGNIEKPVVRKSSEKISGGRIVNDQQVIILCKSIVKNTRYLIEKHDMTINEVKLTLALEKPLSMEQMSGENDFWIPRENVVQAFMEVVGGKVPKDRIALSTLAKDMETWSLISKKQRQNSMDNNTQKYPQNNSTYKPEETNYKDSTSKTPELTETISKWAGLGILYFVTVIPLLIAAFSIAGLLISSQK